MQCHITFRVFDAAADLLTRPGHDFELDLVPERAVPTTGLLTRVRLLENGTAHPLVFDIGFHGVALT
jgi:hypothetical protein